VKQPGRVREALIKKGLAGSAAKRHMMRLEAGDANFARYSCQRCGMTFVVGYKSQVGQGAGNRKLEFTDTTALDTRCSGKVIPG
jgi:transposase-like protein